MNRNFSNCWQHKSLVQGMVCLILLGSMMGCASLPSTIQRKFIRKKKNRGKPPVAITTQGYNYQLLPEEWYRHHYSLWTYWHAELLEGLSNSRKKILRSSEECINELETLQGMVQPSRGERLDPHLKDLRKLHEQAKKNALTSTRISRWRRKVEKQKRLVHEQFSWKKINDYVVHDAPYPSVD